VAHSVGELIEMAKAVSEREFARQLRAIKKTSAKPARQARVRTRRWIKVSSNNLRPSCASRLAKKQEDSAMAFNPEWDVLIADDAAAMRRIVRGLLKELGFKHTREAENGWIPYLKVSAE